MTQGSRSRNHIERRGYTARCSAPRERSAGVSLPVVADAAPAQLEPEADVADPIAIIRIDGSIVIVAVTSPG